MLDKFIYGDVSRISPEAPVPIVKIEKEFYSLGGAANVASNVSTLGGDVSLFGFIGNDSEAKIIKKLLEEKKIKHYLQESTKTTLKVRIIARNHQFLRMDYENCEDKHFSQEIFKNLKSALQFCEIVIISDYAKGTITDEIMDFLRQNNSKIIVDPKPENINLYKNVFLLTPNEKEALEMSSQKDIYLAARHLRKIGNIIVTRGEKGMLLVSDKELEIPTYAREVYDVTGAGDTVISALALSLASDASLEEAAIIANHAASISVSKAGTYSVNLIDLEKKFIGEESKTKSFTELTEIIEDLKKQGKKIVWTNGCFDLLHEGHIKYLKKAKEQGNFLVLGLNSDSSIKRLKGANRPIMPEKTRAEILASLEFVDFIIIFDEDSPCKHLSILKPDIYVKGGDYTLDTINQIERRIIESYGGKIFITGLVEGISTSKIIEKMKNDISLH